jgi:hypothetical protein
LEVKPNVDGFILELQVNGTEYQAYIKPSLWNRLRIESSQTVTEVTIDVTPLFDCCEAISFVNSVAQTTFIVEDNFFFEGYSSASGSGNKLGAGIEIACSNAIVQRNVIDYTNSINGGYQGILVQGPQTALIEKNAVYGFVETGLHVQEFVNTPQSIRIANNMITGGNYVIFTGAPNSPIAILSETRNATIAHNTIVVPGGTVNPTCFRVTGENCVLIILLKLRCRFTVAYDLEIFKPSSIDYNVILKSKPM